MNTQIKNSINEMLNNIANFTEEEKNLITSSGRIVNIPENWAPIHEGTPADKVYLIINGSATVKRNGQEIAKLERGSIIGETAIHNRSLRNATVIAASDIRALHFTKEEWEEINSNIPRLSKFTSETVKNRNNH